MTSPAELQAIAAAFKDKLQRAMAMSNMPEKLRQAMTQMHEGYAGATGEVIEGLQQADAKKTLGVALAGGGAGAAAGGTAGYLAGKSKGEAEADPMAKIMANLEKLSSADKVQTVMSEYKAGTLHSGAKDGPKVTNRKQAIAIALSEAGKTKKQASYRGFLSPKEHAACMHTGAMLYAASAGMRKQALFEGVGDVFDAGTKAVIVGSLVTGVPVGIMAHMLTNAAKRVKSDELIRKQQLDYYRTAGSNLESAMANQGVQS